MGYVLRTVVQQLLQLQIGELLYDLFFSSDLLRIDRFELLHLILFLKLVLYQSAPPMEHLIKAILESSRYMLILELLASLGVSVWLISVVPNVVGDESLDTGDGALGEEVLLDRGKSLNQPRNVFNKDVVTRDHHLLLRHFVVGRRRHEHLILHAVL